VLAFTTFGAAMPQHIAERGFEVRIHWLRSRVHGILGGPWPVFVATRVR
jgi:hypothetical protein